MLKAHSVQPVELMLNFIAVDEDGSDDPNVMLGNPDQPLQHADRLPGAGGVVFVPRVGETITIRTSRWKGSGDLGGEVNETWEVAQVHWVMSDISRSKTTPTQVATLRVKPSPLVR